VLLISLAFLATGAFLGLHAIGTPGILFSGELSGFKVAILVGLLVAALCAHSARHLWTARRIRGHGHA
jgi:hypothetical protein